MRWLWKLAAGLAGLVILGVVVLVLLTDYIARIAMISSIRAQTGLEAKIDRVNVGLLRPTLRVDNFVLHSTDSFNREPMLTIPEVSIEYDREAAGRQQLRLKSVRLNISEIQIVENALGSTNLSTFPGWLGKIQIPQGEIPTGAVQFRGIDELNLTLGRIRFRSYKDSSKNLDVDLGVRNEIIRNVTSETNLYPLLIKIALRGGLQLLGTPSGNWNPLDK
jgi:uncharacterized protein involved in outer membrane biogenesis